MPSLIRRLALSLALSSALAAVLASEAAPGSRWADVPTQALSAAPPPSPIRC